MQTIENIINAFRHHGYKITPQRRLIFKILHNNEDHPRAEEIYSAAKEIMPDISRTTVYNTLKELVGLGLVEPVQNIDENSARFDPRISTHHHLYCQHCHRIIDVDLDVSGIIPPPDASIGFEILRKQITFFGYCPNCQDHKLGNL